MTVDDINEPVFVSVPIHVGKSLGDSLYDSLLKTEQEAIGKAGQAIYQTYLTAIENIEHLFSTLYVFFFIIVYMCL